MTTGSKAKRIVLFGGTGMLGSMVARLAFEQGFDVRRIDRSKDEFDAMSPSRTWTRLLDGADLAINCVAITRSMHNVEQVFRVNSWFPKYLGAIAEEVSVPVVHISTDAVFKGRTEAYGEKELHDAEDVYGTSKSLGEIQSANAINVRCSIVGLERHPRGHLLEWFLAHADGSEVPGFTDHIWHGVTTLQLARFALNFIEPEYFSNVRHQSGAIHFTPNKPLSKFELLKEINEVYGRKIKIKPMQSNSPRVRVLTSGTQREARFVENSHTLHQALEELQSYSKTEEAQT